jgi:hypothetical protein
MPVRATPNVHAPALRPEPTSPGVTIASGW